MKSRRFKKVLSLLAFVAICSTFTSCNKGYGCPNNFGMNETVIKVVKVVVQTAVKL